MFALSFASQFATISMYSRTEIASQMSSDITTLFLSWTLKMNSRQRSPTSVKQRYKVMTKTRRRMVGFDVFFNLYITLFCSVVYNIILFLSLLLLSYYTATNYTTDFDKMSRNGFM